MKTYKVGDTVSIRIPASRVFIWGKKHTKKQLEECRDRYRLLTFMTQADADAFNAGLTEDKPTAASRRVSADIAKCLKR